MRIIQFRICVPKFLSRVQCGKQAGKRYGYVYGEGNGKTVAGRGICEGLEGTGRNGIYADYLVILMQESRLVYAKRDFCVIVEEEHKKFREENK